MKTIYWDYNATAPLRPQVQERITEVMKKYPGNPSSMHRLGQEAKAYVESVRRKVAASLKVKPTELIFTASATEANFLALWGLWLKARKTGKSKKILASSLEHSSIRNNLAFLCEEEGVEIEEIPLTSEGEVDFEALEEKLKTEKFWACSLYAACNESGVIYPWEKLAALCRKYEVPFHCDMVQLLGREHFDLAESDSRPQTATFAFHKSGGLKAVGLLFVEQGAEWEPVLRGGGQEKKRRAGTENLLGIASVDAFFDELPKILKTYQSQVRQVRDDFEKQLKIRCPSAKIVGENLKRLPNTSYVIFPGVASDEMLMCLDLKEICASAGSACTSGLSMASTPLLSLGFSSDDAKSAVRFSLGESSDSDQVPQVISCIEEVLKKKRRIRFDAA